MTKQIFFSILLLLASQATDIFAATYMNSASLKSGDIELTGNYNAKYGGINISRTERTVFEAGTMVRGKLGNSKLRKTKLIDLDMQTMDFETADVSEADFAWTNLKGAKLERAKVAKAHFEKTFGLTPQQKKNLKSRGAFVADKDPVNKPGQMAAAAARGDLQKIQSLIKAGISVDEPDLDNITPLLRAVQNENFEVAEFLLENKANINAVDPVENSTPLLLALVNDNKKMAELLLRFKPNLNIKLKQNGHTALSLALAKKFDDIADLLLQHDVNVNTHDENKVSPLMLCAHQCKSTSTLVNLIKKGADIYAKDKNGYTALNYAELSKSRERENLLRNYGAGSEIMTIHHAGLLRSALSDNDEALMWHLQKGANIDFQNPTGLTALMFTALYDNPKTMEILLKSGANPNSRDNKGITALMYAANHGYINCVNLLLAYKANVSLLDNEKRNAAKLAQFGGYDNIAELIETHQQKQEKAEL